MADKKVYGLMILTTLFWSGAFIAGKLAMIEFTAPTLTCVRFLIALPFIFCVLKVMDKDAWWPTKQQWLPILFVGTIGTFAYHILFFLSVKYTSAGNAALIGATMPGVTMLLTVIGLKERTNARQLLGIALAFVGVTTVITNGNLAMLRQLQLNFGDAMMFCAVLSISLYTIFNRLFMMKYNISPYKMTAFTFLVCTIEASPWAIADALSGTLQTVTLGGWMSVAYMSVFASVMGYLFQLIAVREIGPTRSAVFNNLIPVFTLTLAALILGEPISLYKAVAVVIIISGIYLATQTKVKG